MVIEQVGVVDVLSGKVRGGSGGVYSCLALIVNKKNTKTRKIDTVKRRHDEGWGGGETTLRRRGRHRVLFSFRRNEAWKIGLWHSFFPFFLPFFPCAYLNIYTYKYVDNIYLQTDEFVSLRFIFPPSSNISRCPSHICRRIKDIYVIQSSLYTYTIIHTYFILNAITVVIFHWYFVSVRLIHIGSYSPSVYIGASKIF